MTGTVISYNYAKAYGFIKPDNGKENIFFHVTHCNDIPEAQMRVQYDIAKGRNGFETEAVNVSII